MKDRLLVWGQGFLGRRLRDYFNCAICTGRISSLKDAQGEIDRLRPQAIINCIGYVGRNVDDCELDKDKALFANAFVPIILAEAAFRNKIKLIHISSGCIYQYDYQKDKPIGEEKAPDFFDLFYSRSKIYAEGALEALCAKCNILVVRPRVPLDDRPHPRGLLTKLINYRKVIDLPNSVTYIPDFLKGIEHLLKIDARGFYNLVNKGGLRYKDLLEAYKRRAPGFKYEIIDFSKLKLSRTNLILSTRKLEESGFQVRDINDVLEECVENYLKY
jgi:dTDP-4-dehydrorhamnose reductase